MHGVHEQVHVYELIGKKSVVGIVEDGLQLVSAGGRIDFVIDSEQLASGNLPRVVAVVGIHGEMNSGAELAADLGKLVLRKAEEHGDGLKLRDDHEAIGIVGVHDISRINEAQADAAIDGSGDPAISELKFGIVNLALIGFDGAVKLTDKRGLRIELLLRDHAFVKKKLVTLQVDFRVLALGLILGKLAFGLFELDLKRPRINLYENIALVHELTFSKGHIDNLTVNATAHRDGVKGGYGPEAVEVDGKVAALGGSNDNGHDKVAHARASRASFGFSRRRGPKRIGRFTWSSGSPEIPNADHHADDNQQPEPPETLRGLRRRCSSCRVGAWFGQAHRVELPHSSTPNQCTKHCARASKPSKGRAITGTPRAAAPKG